MTDTTMTDKATTDTSTIELTPMTHAHLDAAAALSRGEQWPHRRADWALLLGLSHGIAAVEGARLVGTALATPFGPVGMLNMIIVAPDRRGRGLARAMMERLMERDPACAWRLVATEDGLPLYRKLGFVETGRVLQHQGMLAPVADIGGAVWAETADRDAIVTLDRAATGMDRAPLLDALASTGRFAVLRDGAGLGGYAALRPFGRGEVAGPVIARNAEDARRLLAFLFARRTGAFLRVDTTEASGLAPWLTGCGLAGVGGGIAMLRGARPQPTDFDTFALAAQALG